MLALDGDIITGADDLVRALTGEKIGRSVALDVLRGTERLTISLVPQERKRARMNDARADRCDGLIVPAPVLRCAWNHYLPDLRTNVAPGNKSLLSIIGAQ